MSAPLPRSAAGVIERTEIAERWRPCDCGATTFCTCEGAPSTEIPLLFEVLIDAELYRILTTPGDCMSERTPEPQPLQAPPLVPSEQPELPNEDEPGDEPEPERN